MCKPLYITWASIFLCRSDQVCIREETFSRIPMYHSVLLRVCVSGPIWPHLFQPLGFEPQLASARRVENLRGENHRSRSPLLSVYLIWLEVCNQDSIFFFFDFLGSWEPKRCNAFWIPPLWNANMAKKSQKGMYGTCLIYTQDLRSRSLFLSGAFYENKRAEPCFVLTFRRKMHISQHLAFGLFI